MSLTRSPTGIPVSSSDSRLPSRRAHFCDWREHGCAVCGEDDEQPWNAAALLSGAETRVEVCLVEAELRGRLEDVASKAVESVRVSKRWCVAPGEPIFARRIRYDLDEWSDLPVPEGYRVDPFCESG